MFCADLHEACSSFAGWRSLWVTYSLVSDMRHWVIRPPSSRGQNLHGAITPQYSGFSIDLADNDFGLPPGSQRADAWRETERAFRLLLSKWRRIHVENSKWTSSFKNICPKKHFLFPFEQNLLIAANQPDRYGHNKCLFDQNYFNFLSITKLCSSCTA